MKLIIGLGPTYLTVRLFSTIRTRLTERFLSDYILFI